MKKSAQNLINKIYDKDFRTQLKQNPKKCLQEHGYSNDDADITYKVVESNASIYYVVFPDNNVLQQQDIDNIHAAGGTVGSVGSVSTASSAGTFSTTFSSAGSAGSVGTIGSAKT